LRLWQLELEVSAQGLLGMENYSFFSRQHKSNMHGIGSMRWDILVALSYPYLIAHFFYYLGSISDPFHQLFILIRGPSSTTKRLAKSFHTCAVFNFAADNRQD
jgi:hypothetical protein